MTPFALSVEELKERLARGEEIVILDVREKDEFEYANIGGKWIPLGELPMRLSELDREREICVLCHHGVRSARATEFLRRSGFAKVLNISGGIDAWSERIDPSIRKY
jgi:rhodanese-related sulfurtransferase